MGFGFIGALLAGLAVTGIVTSQKIHGIAVVNYHRGIEGSGALSDVLAYLREYRIIIYSHMTAQTLEDRNELDERFAKNRANLNEAVEAYAKTALTPLADESEERIDIVKPEVDKLREAITELNEVNQRIIEQSRRTGFDGTIAMVKGEGKGASRFDVGGKAPQTRPATAVKLPQGGGKPPAYVSPIRPLPLAAKANGTTGAPVAEDWNEF